jgi:hypothetical protein
MRCQIDFKVISVFFLMILTSFTSLKAEQSEFTSFVAKSSLVTTHPNETTTHDSAEATKVSAVQASLVGRWESPNFMLEDGNNVRDTNGRSLKYDFRADGTYTKVLGGAEVQVEEQGTWSLSKDGKQLIMKSKTLCDGQLVTNIANIKHLVMDEMVLEQTLCVAGTVVNTAPKSLYFNKY